MIDLISCIQCREKYESTDELTYWDESGYGYSVKLSKCPHCGQLNILKYKIDNDFNDRNEER